MGQIEAYLEHRYPENQEVRKSLVNLVHNYAEWGLKDSKFESDFTSGRDEQFYGYIWEMVLASHLIDQGLDIHSGDEGPDFGFPYHDQKVWVEATCPAPEGIPDDWFHISAIGDTPLVKSVPHEQILLRWTSALKEKKEKLTGRFQTNRNWKPGYLENGVVGVTDPYVVAVSACRLGPTSIHLSEGISQLPYAVEASFPVGPIEVVVDRGTLKTVDQRLSHRPVIKKPNGANVPTDSFLNPEYSGVSALLGSSAGINAACGEKTPIALVHNPLARNPLPQGILGVDQEFVADDHGEHYELRDIKNN